MHVILILRQNYMHDISSVDLVNEKGQIAAVLVVGNSTLYAFVVDGIHLIGFGTIKLKLCLRRDNIALNRPVSVCVITLVQFMTLTFLPLICLCCVSAVRERFPRLLKLVRSL